MNKPMLTVVLEELQARKGSWRDISRAIDPASHASYYSWLTKLAQGSIREPSVNKIQRLYDYFHGNDTGEASSKESVNTRLNAGGDSVASAAQFSPCDVGGGDGRA